ncbi:hypothetical protein MHI01_10820 [Paenibacillus sp. FSL M7-0656]|uniref:hypothetical protein n=1 Tax=Paenibacillus sp. FSL M7-0656 TaxID=2921534 RepID=UPI0030F96554
MCTVGYLEATINEFLSNIKDENYNNNKRLKPKKRELINSMWELGIPKTAKYSILEKYQIALTLADKNLFKKGVSPYQDVYLLIQVRNAITHYEPEWVTTESEFPVQVRMSSKHLNILSGRIVILSAKAKKMRGCICRDYEMAFSSQYPCWVSRCQRRPIQRLDPLMRTHKSGEAA